MNFKSITNIEAFWFDDTGLNLFKSVPGSIKASSSSIRFGLALEGNSEVDFEVVISMEDHAFTYKADCFEDAEATEPVRLFLGTDECIFFADGEGGRVYFHLYK